MRFRRRRRSGYKSRRGRAGRRRRVRPSRIGIRW